LAASGLFGWVLRPAFRSLDLPRSPWTTEAQMRKVAAYLNRQTLVPKFHAQVYKIKLRDNFWSIAGDFGVNISTVVGCNPYLTGFLARAKRPILMVNRVGTLYQVQSGDSLASVAQAYGVSPTALSAANRIPWFGPLVGEVLFIPDAEPRNLNPAMAKLFAMRKIFISPVSGRLSSPFGQRIDPFNHVTREFHPGVDIAVPFNTPVSAAAAGTVVLAAWWDGYGKAIILQHAHGYRTLYGHLNTFLVHTGQKVYRGQVIGRVGLTGWTTGPHLIFDIWKNGRLVDPLKYLW
jgi:LysM repeat protein